MELASKLGVEKMDRLVNDALSKGAKRLTVESVEDKKVAEGAHAYLPVILDNVKPDQDIYYQGEYESRSIVTIKLTENLFSHRQKHSAQALLLSVPKIPRMLSG